MRSRPTQKDVAEKAGVSQATVSMVLSDKLTPSIPNETVERIRAIAKELGYSPNRVAQALKTRRTMMIACIVPDITNPFYPRLVRGVQSEAQRHNYDVITLNTDGTREHERYYLRWAQEGRVDGVVGVFFSLRVPDFAEAIEAGLPIVRIESSRKTGGSIAIDDIFVDSKAATISVIDYLLDAGHRRIAMIAGSGGPQRVRVEGYQERLAEAGLEPMVVIDEAFSEIGGFHAAERILASNFKPTAVYAANDLMAIGAMQALSAHGIDIPGEIAVAGFDDIPAAKLVSPPLSTVTQFQDKLGEKAAQCLLERLNGNKNGVGMAHEMPYQLVRRGSV